MPNKKNMGYIEVTNGDDLSMCFVVRQSGMPAAADGVVTTSCSPFWFVGRVHAALANTYLETVTVAIGNFSVKVPKLYNFRAMKKGDTITRGLEI